MSQPTEQLQHDLHAVARDVENLLREARDNAGARAGDFTARLHALSDRLQHLERQASGRFRDVADQASGYVRERPWTAIGLAAAGAFLLGLLSRGPGRD